MTKEHGSSVCTSVKYLTSEKEIDGTYERKLNPKSHLDRKIGELKND